MLLFSAMRFEETGTLAIWGYTVDPTRYDPLNLDHRKLLATFPVAKDRYGTLNLIECIRQLRNSGQLTIPSAEIASIELSFSDKDIHV